MTRQEIDIQYDSYKRGYKLGQGGIPFDLRYASMFTENLDAQQYRRGYDHGTEDLNKRMKAEFERLNSKIVVAHLISADEDALAFKRGMIAEVVFLPPFVMKLPLYDRRRHEGKNYYLCYYRESDGAIPSWRSDVKLLPDEPIIKEVDLIRGINYSSDGALNAVDISGNGMYPGEADAEEAWTNLVNRS
jgi:hypothetical protein